MRISDWSSDVCSSDLVFYDAAFAQALLPWFGRLRQAGAIVLIGDPGRAYLPKQALQALAVSEVPVTRALEDGEVKRRTEERRVGKEGFRTGRCRGAQEY